MHWLARRISALLVVFGFLGAQPWPFAMQSTVRVVDLAAEAEERSASEDEEQTSKAKQASDKSAQNRNRRNRGLSRKRRLSRARQPRFRARWHPPVRRAPFTMHDAPVLRLHVPPRQPPAEDDPAEQRVLLAAA